MNPIALALRSLPVLEITLPLAALVGVVVNVIAWAVLRDRRPRVQFALTAAAFGGTLAGKMHDMATGVLYALMRGSSPNPNAFNAAEILGWLEGVAIVGVMVGASTLFSKRLSLAPTLLVLAWIAGAACVTIPAITVRGG